MRQAEGRRRKSDLRTQPVIYAEARLGTRFARLGSLQNASPAYAAVMAEYGYLSDVRKPSRAWSRTRARDIDEVSLASVEGGVVKDVKGNGR